MSSSKQPRSRGALALLVRLAVFLLVFGGFAEVWFRTVMPAAEMPDLYQQNPATIYRFDPSRSTVGLYTVGRLCRDGGWWRINRAGWNSDVQYTSGSVRRRPMVALFGDSYIEGLLTNADQHIDAYLPKMLPGTASYAYGVSAWYLEQYVAVSRYAKEQFQPDVLVIFVDQGDVSDSIRANGVLSPYWWQIGARGTSFVELPPTAVKTMTRKALLAKRSALIRYMRYNAKLSLPGMPIVGVAQPVAGGGAPGEGAASPGGDAWQSLVPAADFMIGRLCAEHPGVPIVFVATELATGARYLPLRDIARMPMSPDATAVRAAALPRSQCSFLDLRSAFSHDWAVHHVRFEAADGAHWNAYANRLVARTLAGFITRNRLLPQAP